MDRTRLRETLEKTGMTQYEASALIGLLELGSASATDIADASDVPQARIYDTVRSLKRKGHVETYEDGNLHARVQDIETLKEDLESHAETVSDALTEVEQRWTKPRTADHEVSVVKPLSAIYNRAADAIEDAENEIQLACTPEQFEGFRDALVAAIDRGVVVKLTITPSELGEPDFETLGVEGAATEVRYRRLPTPFLLLSDRIRVCYAPESTLHPTHEYGVLVSDYSLSRQFDWSFQTAFWTHWEEIYSARNGTLPATYTKIRECIWHIADAVEDGRKVVVTVYGYLEGEEELGEFTGRIIDVEYTGRPSDGHVPLAAFLEEAKLTLDTPDGEFVVGGWGAMLEEVEGRRFIVESIEAEE